jgi:hypothetical protein
MTSNRSPEEPLGVPALTTEHGTIDGYRVVYEQGPRNWSAYSPDVPGCIATGRDRWHVERMMREAIAFHLEDEGY